MVCCLVTAVRGVKNAAEFSAAPDPISIREPPSLLGQLLRRDDTIRFIIVDVYVQVA